MFGWHFVGTYGPKCEMTTDMSSMATTDQISVETNTAETPELTSSELTTDLPTTWVSASEVPSTQFTTPEAATTQFSTSIPPTTEFTTSEMPTTELSTFGMPTTTNVVSSTEYPSTTEILTTTELLTTAELATSEVPTTELTTELTSPIESTTEQLTTSFEPSTLASSCPPGRVLTFLFIIYAIVSTSLEHLTFYYCNSQYYFSSL